MVTHSALLSGISPAIRAYNGEIDSGEAVQPLALRTASTDNRIPSIRDNNSTRRNFGFRSDYLIGQDVKNLLFRFDNWFMNASGVFDIGNDYTLDEVSIEGPNGVVLPLMFSSGRSVTIAAGAIDVQAISVPASAFGLSKISKGETYWLKGHGSVPVAGDYFPNTQDIVTSRYSGRQTFWYNATETTLSSTDTAGEYSATGVARYNRLNSFSPFLWGEPLEDVPTFGIVGDSISAGFADTTSLEHSGQGFFARGVYGDGVDLRAGLVLARGGTNGTHYLDVPRILDLYKYAHYWFEAMCTNDLGATGGITVAALQLRKQALWNNMKDNGALGVIGVEPFYRLATPNADNFSTTANQVYTDAATWGPGGSADQIEDWLATRVTAGELLAVCSTADTRDSVETRKAAVNGTANWSVSDGVHPRTPVNILMADNVVTPLIRSIT